MASAGELGVDNVMDVLEHTFNLEGHEHGSEFKIACPNPAHDDTHPSCGINLVTGYWHCFSCGTGGDLVELGALVTGLTRRQIMSDLRPSTVEALQNTLHHRLKKLKINTSPMMSAYMAAPKLRLPGPYSPDPMDYLLGRGISMPTIRKWGVRYCDSQELQGKSGLFNISDSVAIPIRDEKQRLLSWCYRATPDSLRWQPKYIYTPEADISKFWWGMQHHANKDHIFVIEGAIDGMALDQMGYPALAMLGSHMPEDKVKQLQRFKSVTIVGDRDKSGVLMVRRIGAVLGRRMPIKVVRFASWMPGKDVNTMNPIDVDIAISRAVSWTRFALQNR